MTTLERLERDIVIYSARRNGKGRAPTALVARVFGIKPRQVKRVVASIHQRLTEDTALFSSPTYAEAFRSGRSRRKMTPARDLDN